MWHCPGCEEKIEDQSDSCWNCGTMVGDATEFELDSIEAETNPQDRTEEGQTESIDLQHEDQPFSRNKGGMSRLEIAELISKTIALVLFAQGTYILVNTVFLFFQESSLIFALLHGVWYTDAAIPFTGLIPMAAPLLLGCVFWHKSHAIAERMVSNNLSEVTGNTLSIEDMTTLVFSALGVIVLLKGLSRSLVVIFLVKSYSLVSSEFWFSPETWSGLLEFSVGLWLLLGANGIVKGIQWLRAVGNEHSE